MVTLSVFPPTCWLMRGSDVCKSRCNSWINSCFLQPSAVRVERGVKASSDLKLFDGELWKWLTVSSAFISAPILCLLTDWYLYWQQFVYNWNLRREVDLAHICPWRCLKISFRVYSELCLSLSKWWCASEHKRFWLVFLTCPALPLQIFLLHLSSVLDPNGRMAVW